MSIVPCPPNTPPVHGVVQFVFSEFIVDFPEFTGNAPAQCQAAFNNATMILANTCRSLISNATKRQYLLYLLTAHITFLRFGSNDGAGVIVPAPGVVGRISNAHEGSVSAGMDYASTTSLAAAWFIQTKWGADFWASTMQYRTMRYIVPPSACCGVCGFALCLCGGFGPTGSGGPGYNGGTS